MFLLTEFLAIYTNREITIPGIAMLQQILKISPVLSVRGKKVMLLGKFVVHNVQRSVSVYSLDVIWYNNIFTTTATAAAATATAATATATATATTT